MTQLSPEQLMKMKDQFVGDMAQKTEDKPELVNFEEEAKKANW